MATVLKVKDLKISLKGKKRRTCPVENVNFEIHTGETLALVGESGSGKSMTALSIMGLLQSWNSYLRASIEGTIEFVARNGKKYLLNQIPEEEYDKIRGKDLSIIFQEPSSVLNPVVSVGNQLVEGILTHEKVSKREAAEISVALLERVGIPDAENRFGFFPHQFSGGQLQRIMIAMAIACDPVCLIADEPTTALDVTIQDQILVLLKQLQQERKMSILLITHDLGIVSQFAEKVAVMYSGYILEYGRVDKIFENPVHPYTKLLLKSIPSLETQPGEKLMTKEDFLSIRNKKPGDIVFDPENRIGSGFGKINDGHYVSSIFTREV